MHILEIFVAKASEKPYNLYASRYRHFDRGRGWGYSLSIRGFNHVAKISSTESRKKGRNDHVSLF